jgi:hypothetical protein
MTRQPVSATSGSPLKRWVSRSTWPSTDCAVELAVEGRYRLSISDMNRTSSSAATCSAVGSGFFFVTVSSVSVITAPFQLNTRPSNQGRKHLQLQRPERQPSTLVKDLGQAVVLR